MVYAFNFELFDHRLIYYEGCEKEEEARTKLERIAIGHCRNDCDLGIGKIFRIEGGEREVLSSYNYLFKDGELVREVLN